MEVRELGLLSYEETWKLQLSLLEERAEEKIPDTILLVEHPSVFTFGRKSPGLREGKVFPSSIQGVPVFCVERGGEATYHGPGQLVLYPIFRVDLRTGPKNFLRFLEESIVDVLGQLGVSSYWIEGKTGVWLLGPSGEKKIASLGIAVRKSITYHGLALNVNTDLTPFQWIQPCGFSSEVMTSMKEILGQEVSLKRVGELLVATVKARFEALKAKR